MRSTLIIFCLCLALAAMVLFPTTVEGCCGGAGLAGLAGLKGWMLNVSFVLLPNWVFDVQSPERRWRPVEQAPRAQGEPPQQRGGGEWPGDALHGGRRGGRGRGRTWRDGPHAARRLTGERILSLKNKCWTWTEFLKHIFFNDFR